jgi:DNA-binding transcriptional MerR regulator
VATTQTIETPVSTTARGAKSQAAFRTISEVADELDVAQHVLRFWESKFPQVRPLKRGGGRRYYRPEDIDLLRDIRSLLYDEGYTIKGAQKLLRQRRAKPAAPAKPAEPAHAQPELQGTSTASPSTSGPAAAGSSDHEHGARATPSAHHATDPSAEPLSSSVPNPPADPASQPATSNLDIAALERLRAELVELRRAVSAALDSDEG